MVSQHCYSVLGPASDEGLARLHSSYDSWLTRRHDDLLSLHESNPATSTIANVWPIHHQPGTWHANLGSTGCTTPDVLVSCLFPKLHQHDRQTFDGVENTRHKTHPRIHVPVGVQLQVEVEPVVLLDAAREVLVPP